ncbi:hypothetical protein Pelo_15219 [Pelomyxa schiedti]|nr:hypothetical protein Pelo_15219 [Pelomyxa schiedti]
MERVHGYDVAKIKPLLTGHQSGLLRKGLLGEPEFWEYVEKELRKQGLDYNVNTIRDCWYRGYKPDPHLWLLAKKLKSTCTLLCFTGNVRSRVAFLQMQYGFEDLFDAKLYSYDYHMSKRDPAFYQELIKAAGCAPEELLLIDDDPRHKEIANSLGINCIIYTGNVCDLVAQLHSFGIPEAASVLVSKY